MNNSICLLAPLFCLASFLAKDQDLNWFRKAVKSDSTVILKGDFIPEKVNNLTQRTSTKIDSFYDSILTLSDTTETDKVRTLKQTLQHRIDSLNVKRILYSSLRLKLDSGLLTLKKMPGLDTLSSIKNTVKEKVNEVQSIRTKPGFDSSGQGLNMKVNTPDFSTPDIVKPKLPSEGIAVVDLKKSSVIDDLDSQADKLGEVVQHVVDVTKNVNEYGKEIEPLKEEGLIKSGKLSDLAEKQLAEIDEAKAIQAEIAPVDKRMPEYQKLIEQYKDEKRIEAELKEKMRDQATGIIVKNQGKVDDAMKKISKISHKYPQVHDKRYLPKRPPNPLKELSWRERLIPGLVFSTLTNNTTWMEFDPQGQFISWKPWDLN